MLLERLTQPNGRNIVARPDPAFSATITSGVPRPDARDIDTRSNKDHIYLTEEEGTRAFGFGHADVLMLHEWPSGVIAPDNEAEFEQQRRSLRYDWVGNAPARLLVDLLEPELVVRGHLHKRYRNRLVHPSGKTTEVCGLASVEQGADAVAFWELTAEGELKPAC